MTERTRTLGQLIGVERHYRQADNDAGKVIMKNVQSEPLVTGSSRVYTPDDKDAPSSAREPDQYKAVAVKVEEALRDAMAHAIRAMDVVASKDRTNCAAAADIVIDGTVLVPGVPVSHLLWLEDYLAEWKKFLNVLPVLDPTRNWTFDTGRNVWKRDPEENIRLLKEPAALVLYPATDKHPAQTQSYQKDVRVGKYVTIVESGAIPETRKKALLLHCMLLMAAVKDAIARANHTPVTEVKEGEALFRYLLG